MSNIHPSAVIEKGASIADNVSIGAFCHIGPKVTLHENVKLHSHVVITGDTSVGAHTEVYPFASLGHAPQDLKFDGEETKLIIGEYNRIREHATMNPGTKGGGGVTKVGNHGLFMTATHIAHDCIVGDHVILANNATAAGHVTIGNYAVMGGFSGVHQFVRIGDYAMLGGMSGLEHDLIPFGMAFGNRSRMQGLNLVGMKRANFDRNSIKALRSAYDDLFADETTLQDRLDKITSAYGDNSFVMQVADFAKVKSKRGLLSR